MSSRFSRRHLLRIGTAFTAAAGTLGPHVFSRRPLPAYAQGETIKVGVLHSLTGTMAISELSLRDVCMLAIDEINSAGGVLGKQVECIIEDGESNWPVFAEKARKLIEVDEVASVFGCWTSASRKAVLPIFEELEHMLWYPVQYEGNECSKNIMYTPATPNQQTKLALDYLVRELGSRKIYLEASDYVYPRTANQIAKAQIEVLQQEFPDLQLVGENYLPLGTQDYLGGFGYTTAVEQIVQSGADGILNTVNGDSNISFFSQMSLQGLTPDNCPVMSSSLSEDDVRSIGAELVTGHYAVWNYFQTIDRPRNRAFVTAFKSRFGNDRTTGDPIEKAYVGINMWKAAAEKAGTVDIPAVREATYGLSYDAPSGVHIMRGNHHTRKPAFVGRHNAQGLFDIVASLGDIEPQTWDPLIAGSNVCDWSQYPEGTVQIDNRPADMFR